MIDRKVILGPKVLELIKTLSKKIEGLPQPIHLLAVFSGGVPLSLELKNLLDKSGIKNEVYTVWLDTIGKESKCYLGETDFTKEKYTGTVVIIEDVLWTGHHLPPIKKMLEEMAPKKKFYIAALFDCGQLADFSIYP